MFRNRRLLLPLSCLLLVLLCQSCAKSKLVTSWMDSERAGYQLDKVLVVGVFNDPVTQQIYENSFVDLLKGAGVQAVAGNQYNIGPDEPKKAAIDSALQESGATSVLLTHVLSETKMTTNYPPIYNYAVYGGYWDSVSGYHSYVYGQVWADGNSVEERVQRMEITLFDGEGGKPVWSARSKSVNLEDRLRRDDEELEKIFLGDLRRKKIL